MPQVPTLQNQVSPDAAPNFQQRPLERTVARDIGQGVSNVGNVLFQVQQEEQRKADRAALVEAKTRLDDAQAALLYDPEKGALAKQGKDAFDLPGQVLPEYEKSASAITQGLKSDRQKRAFSEMYAESRTQLMGDLNRHEFTQREKYYDQTDEALVAATIKNAGRNAYRPERIASELQTQKAVIAGLAKRKGWDSAQTEQQQAEFESKTHEAVVGNFLVDNDYSNARKYLATNALRMDDTAVEQMQRRIAVEEEGAFSRQMRQQKIMGDAATKDGDKLLAEGNLTTAWIEAHRNVLDPTDYRYFYTKLKGGDGEASAPRDVPLYSDLRDRAGRGEDVRDEARDALKQGSIRVADYDRLTSEVESEHAGWYKRGSEYITSMSGASLLNPDPAAPQLKASMLDAWGDWARQHPKATDREAQSAYQDIVSHNMLVQRAGLPLPKFLVGGRFSPDLQATAKATVAAHQKGEMKDEDYAREMEVLLRWKRTLEAEQAQVAPK